MNAAKRFPRILIDGVFFQIDRTGIARVWMSLLREWVTTGFAENLLVLDRGNTAPRIDGVRYLTIPMYNYNCTGEDAFRLQALCDQEQADLFVSTYYTTPLTTPSLFLAYDMIPEVNGHELDEPMWREKHYGVQHASAHVAISQSTADDLAKFFPEIRRESVTVAHPGAEATFRPAVAGEVEQFRERYHLMNPYFLLVGSRVGVSGYKNALLFFRAFAALPERHRYAVVCVGGDAVLEPLFQALAADMDVRLLQLQDDELRAAYSGALALAYPSRYEGFGLPVLEAMACGCPVITCRNSSLIEVAADAALFVSETDAAAMTAALQQIQEVETRGRLISQGLNQAVKFSWRDMAAALVAVMHTTATEAPRPLRLWTEFRRVQGLVQKRNAVEQKLLDTERQMADLREEFHKNHRELWEAKALLARVQASKFWRVRSALASSKRTVLRLASQWLPRRAG